MEFLYCTPDSNKENSENSGGSTIKQRVSREERAPLGEITHLWTGKEK